MTETRTSVRMLELVARRARLRATVSDGVMLAERLEVVEITGRARVDHPVDHVEDDERERKAFAREFIDASRPAFAGVHVDGRPWRRNDHGRRTAACTCSRRVAAVNRSCTATARPQLPPITHMHAPSPRYAVTQ